MNQIIQIIVSYNLNEISIELERNSFHIFDIFLKKLSEKTGEKNIINDFELMPVNTSMAYILIDEDNFQNIIEENLAEEKLKIFMKKKEKNDEEENITDTILNSNHKNKIKNDDEDDDDFSDHNDEDIINTDEEKNSKNNINEIYTESKMEKIEDNEIININENITKEINNIYEENNDILNINTIIKN